jgi:hypothetical protein
VRARRKADADVDARVQRPVALVSAFLVAAFGFRLFYGLSTPFWYEDERQVYLVGLQSFARGDWPYYGADVVWTGGRVPGALLGWLVRAPIELLRIPEAPAILLNLLSLGALAGFAWYLARRFTHVPGWLICASLVVLPWTLSFSTHVVNPSYVLAGAIAFFIGLFEAVPALSRRLVPAWVAWALMGFGMFWVMQLHLSWVLLVCYPVAALLLALRDPASPRGRTLVTAVAGFTVGALMPASLLIPTLLRDGLSAGQVGSAVAFQPRHPWGLVATAGRMLSFASFETNRFLGLSTAERALVFWREPWLLPFAAIVTAIGWLHPVWVAVSALRPSGDTSRRREWRAERWLFALSALLVWTSFFWSVRGPQAHSYYLMLPIAVLFSFAAWDERARARRRRLRGFERIAIGVMASSVILHAGLAIDRWPRLSLYANRDLVAAAIDDRNDRYLGDRRGAGEAVTAAPMQELEIVRADWRAVLGRFSTFDVTIANRSDVDAWVDLRFTTSYFGEPGQLLTKRDGVIKRILQPRETRTFEDIADGDVPPGASRATVAFIGAERVVPTRR